MGDILHGLPAIAAVRELYPNDWMSWAIEPHWRPLLAAAGATSRGRLMPHVDRIHEVPTRLWKQRPFSLTTVREIAQLRREMQAEHYDLCLDLQGSIRSAVIGKLSGARHFLGPQAPRERLAGALYGERVATHAQHVIEQACELVHAAFGSSERSLGAAAVQLPFDDEAEVWVGDVLVGLGIKQNERFVFIAPRAGWGAKEWPLERYGLLAATLHKSGYRVLVNAMSADDSLVRTIVDAGHASAVSCNIAQLIQLTRRAALVIGGDTGPMHLGAALGRPTIALFGPTDPARNGPFFPGAQIQVLRHETSRSDHHRNAKMEAGLGRLTVEDVAALAHRLLAQEDESRHG